MNQCSCAFNCRPRAACWAAAEAPVLTAGLVLLGPFVRDAKTNVAGPHTEDTNQHLMSEFRKVDVKIRCSLPTMNCYR
jgi:hypothetical protein